MEINLPNKLRGWLYVIVLIGGPISIYLQAVGIFHDAEMMLWTGLASVIALIARLNLTDDDEGWRHE